MSRIQRIIIALVLAFALPLQGVAAATMAACGPSHHRMEGVAQAHSHFDHDGQPEAQTGVHDHSSLHSQQQSLAGGQAHSDHHAAHGGLDKVSKYKCSACASCCAVAAIPSSLLTLESVSLPEFFAPLELSGIAAFLTEGLERPPRTVLA